MKKMVVLAGTFDSKGEEYQYINNLLGELGISTLTVHAGTWSPSVPVDISNDQVAAAAGYNLKDLQDAGDRGKAVAAMTKGLEVLIPELYRQGLLAGIMALGGSGGTALVTPAMRTLPYGVPKIMISTMAGGNVSPYVGHSDLIMIPSICDISGLNKISRGVFRSSVRAMAGMLGFPSELSPDSWPEKPLIAATMYGVTTPCVTYARKILEDHGYEAAVFHASGNGGRTMEQFIDAGAFCGVLDITTTEWCDELFGGIMAAGPHRSEAAARQGIPQVISVGALDIVTFGPPESVPAICKDRKLHAHNPMITIMRTGKEENMRLGAVLAEKINMAKDKTILLLPLKGISSVDKEGQVFYGPEEDKVLFKTLKSKIDRSRIPVIEMGCHINDEIFARTAALLLMAMIDNK